MAKFDKYILSQLMVLFGFFSLVLVLVYWVSRAAKLFDQLIANGHSALVFLEFSALTIPGVTRIVLPMSAFVAAIYCANRLASDSELVVAQSTGYSPYRLMRPVVLFGVIAGALLSVLVHVLVPASQSQLITRQNEIAQNASARLLREGTFFHPTPGFTFYIGEIDPKGKLYNVFLNDSRTEGTEISYSATSAHLISERGDTLLVLADGLVQTLRMADLSLISTSFQEFIINLTPLFERVGGHRRSPGELSTPELLWPTQALLEETLQSRAVLLQVGHERISQALLCILAAMIGFSAILMGGFSRFSLWRQVVIGIGAIIVVKFTDNLMNDLARQSDQNWPLVYVSSGLGVVLVSAMVWISARPPLFSRIQSHRVRRGS